jgi:hypothetical protein
MYLPETLDSRAFVCLKQGEFDKASRTIPPPWI